LINSKKQSNIELQMDLIDNHVMREKMKAAILAILMLVVANLALAETNKPPLANRNLYLLGTGSGWRTHLSTFKKVPREITQNLLSEFDVYAVRQHGKDLWHPTGEFGSMLIADGQLAVYFENMAEAAEFVSKRIDKVESSQQAEALLSMLPALFGYSIVTKPPRPCPSKDSTTEDPHPRAAEFSDLSPTQVKNPEKWTRQFKMTETGWELQCTLLFDPAIALCNRVTISVDKSGNVTVSAQEEVCSAMQYL
jgi:hypothetical protein